MALKMNLKIITKSHAADSEIGFLTKWISKPIGCTTAMPTAWELKKGAHIFRSTDCATKFLNNHPQEDVEIKMQKPFQILPFDPNVYFDNKNVFISQNAKRGEF